MAVHSNSRERLLAHPISLRSQPWTPDNPLSSSMATFTESLWQSLDFVRQHWILCIVALVGFNLLYNKFQPGLVNIPGPPAAAYTKFWRVYSVWRGSAHLDAIELHKKYGNLVRIAPNHVSVADPKWIPVFYGTKEEYTKVSLSSLGDAGTRTNEYRLASTRFKASPGRSILR